MIFLLNICFREGIPNIWIEANDAQIRKKQWSRKSRYLYYFLTEN